MKYSFDSKLDKESVTNLIENMLKDKGLQIVEKNEDKPWGAYFRINNEQAETFINQFFPGLSMAEAQLGLDDVELSPKILIVEPAKRLSWQYHSRRAECWRFLSRGYYCKNDSDAEVEPLAAKDGSLLQFLQGERHRLIGDESMYTIVAEIWQHTIRGNMSDEEDIVRVQDDFARNL